MKETFNGDANLSVLHDRWTQSCLVGIAGALSVRAMLAVMILVRCITNWKEKYCRLYDNHKGWIKVMKASIG